MSFIAILAVLGMGMLGSVAGFFLKKTSGVENGIVGMLKSPFLYIGGILYLISSILNIYLLKILPYSVVVPLGSLTFVWTMLLSWKLLKERITGKKLVGIVFVFTGVLLISLHK